MSHLRLKPLVLNIISLYPRHGIAYLGNRNLVDCLYRKQKLQKSDVANGKKFMWKPVNY